MHPLEALLLLLLSAATAESQMLVGTPANQIQNVALGTTLLVTCSPADNSAAVQNLKWFGPKNYFDVSSGSSETNLIKGRTDMPLDPTTLDLSRLYTQATGMNGLSLTIENVRLTDSGIYSCRGKVQGIDSAFNISVFPYQSLVVQAATNQYLIQGNEYGVISCSVQGSSPIVQWQINGQDLSTSGSTKYEMTSSGLYVFNPVSSDVGRYTCRGLQPLSGTVQQVYINVDVYVSPKMLGPPEVLGAQGFGIVRQSVVLACNATGYPAPLYSWFTGTAKDVGSKEVNDINFGTRFRPDPSAGTLTILEIRIEDDTWYWCKAQNPANYQMAGVHLNVTMVAYFTWNQNSTDKNDGDTITLTCQSKAVPPANMQWIKWGRSQPYADGVQPDDPRIRVYQKFAAPTEEMQAILPKEVWIEIRNAKPLDMANYTCIATNIAGQNQTTQEIRVNFAPVFVNVTSVVYNWEGNVRNLTCCTMAWPIPTWTWTYLGTVITNDENHKIFYDYTNSSLQIRIPYVTLYGSLWGTYACKASNNRGDAFATVMLAEAQLPDAPYNLSVKTIAPTSITLDVYLAPPLTIPVILIEVRAELPGGSAAPVPFRFDLSQMHNMKIDSLYASTAYTIRVTARNERGLGARDLSRVISTLPIDRPYPLEIVSGSLSSYPGSHLLMWDMVDNGGSPITQFTVKWRQASSNSWESNLISTGSSYFVIPNLIPNTIYEAQVLATNLRGTSDPPTPAYYFRTLNGVIPTVVLQQGNGPVPAAIDLGPLQVSHLVIIVVMGVVAVLLSVDIVCCFTRHCGLFMCIYKTSLHQKSSKLPVQAVSDVDVGPALAEEAAGPETIDPGETARSSEKLYAPGSRSADKRKALDDRDTRAQRASAARGSGGRPTGEAVGNGRPSGGERPSKSREVPRQSTSEAAVAQPPSIIYDNPAYSGVIRKPAYQGSEGGSSTGSPGRLPPAVQGPARQAMQWPVRQAMQGPVPPSSTRPVLSSATGGRGGPLQASGESPYQNVQAMMAARGPQTSAAYLPSSQESSPRWTQRNVAAATADTPAARGAGQSRWPQAAPGGPAREQRGHVNAAVYDTASNASSRGSRLSPQLPMYIGETDVDAFEDFQNPEDREVSHYLGNRPSARNRITLPSASTDV